MPWKLLKRHKKLNKKMKHTAIKVSSFNWKWGSLPAGSLSKPWGEWGELSFPLLSPYSPCGLLRELAGRLERRLKINLEGSTIFPFSIQHSYSKWVFLWTVFKCKFDQVKKVYFWSNQLLNEYFPTFYHDLLRTCFVCGFLRKPSSSVSASLSCFWDW